MARAPPARLRYPTARLDQYTNRLSAQLMRLRRQILFGVISKPQAKQLGHNLLEEHYFDQIKRINEYNQRRGIKVGIGGDEASMRKSLLEKFKEWDGIVDDI